MHIVLGATSNISNRNGQTANKTAEENHQQNRKHRGV